MVWEITYRYLSYKIDKQVVEKYNDSTGGALNAHSNNEG